LKVDPKLIITHGDSNGFGVDKKKASNYDNEIEIGADLEDDEDMSQFNNSKKTTKRKKTKKVKTKKKKGKKGGVS
jgi:hypothetical protein